MPLLDHFHPPVSERRSWEGFHGLWAAALVEKLNRDVLAEEFFADMQVHIGSHVTGDQIELWPRPLCLGQPLPVLPLVLRNAGVVPVDLEETYSEARQRSRLT